MPTQEGKYYPKVGYNNVSSYQLPGRPYLTGSNITGSGTNNGEVSIAFPSVPRSFTVINRTTNPITVHFDSRANANVGANWHYVTLDTVNDSVEFEIRAKTVYISMASAAGTGSFELIGDLTGIDNIEQPAAYSGSGIND